MSLSAGPHHIEIRPLSALLISKQELSSIYTLLLLQDSSGHVIYCWLEGETWTSQARDFQIGEQLLLGPYRWYHVSRETADFYAPAIAGKLVASIYIHYPLNDSSVKVSAKSRIYLDLKEVMSQTRINPWTLRDIVGVVIDVGVRKTCNDTLYHLRIVDESLKPRESLGVHLLTKRHQNPLVIDSLGAVLVVHGCHFQMFSGQPEVSASRHTAGWSSFAYGTGKELSRSETFDSRPDLSVRVSQLYAWTVSNFQTFPMSNLQFTAPTLGHLRLFRGKLIDVIAKILRIQEGFSSGKSVFLIADESGFAFVDCPSFSAPALREGIWVKVHQVKVMESHRLEQPTAIVPMPQSFLDVQIHLRNYELLGPDAIEKEAVASLDRRVSILKDGLERVISKCEDPDLPLWSQRETLSPYSNRTFCRVKGLFIDIQPPGVLTRFSGKLGKFAGMLRLWTGEKEPLQILMTESDALDLFSMELNQPITDIAETVQTQINHFSQGNNWLEVGVRRLVLSNVVLLKLHSTH